ncbi:F-box protein CPR1-like [Silene latifolia]|uniref:F-box protein CPR1-like n=1 Tax=Silene latifolia TaxID=37657 RepID=UPI003D787EB8
MAGVLSIINTKPNKRFLRRNPNSMSRLPADIIHYNILTRLPIKSVLRFKTVCKDWYNYTNSSYFINIHRQDALHESHDYTDLLILCGTPDCFNSSHKYLEAPNYTSGILELIIDVNYTHTSIVGTCNGLICIRCRSLDDISGFVLCNPVTREYSRFIKPPPINYDSILHRDCQYGFGYDVVSHDYKIVNITKLSHDSIVHVYSTNSSSWKEVEKASEMNDVHGTCGVVASNKLHWFIWKRNQGNNDDGILSFDLDTDKFVAMPYPTSFKEYHYDTITLVASIGRLYTIVTDFRLSRVSIWVMKEYGVTESWTKLYEIEQGQFSARLLLVITLRPRRDSGDAVLLLKLVSVVDTQEYLWYDHKNKSIIGKVNVPGNSPANEWVCTASLVPVPGSDPNKRVGYIQKSSSSWKEVEKAPKSVYPCGDQGVVVNNKLHWITSSMLIDTTTSILTFVLNTEEFGQMSYPTKLTIYYHLHKFRLVVSNGRLYIIATHTLSSNVSIWVMKKFVGNQVCTKGGRVIGYRSLRGSGEVLLVKDVSNENQELVWYNLEDTSIREVDVPGSRRIIKNELVCVGSLAPIPDNDSNKCVAVTK